MATMFRYVLAFLMTLCLLPSSAQEETVIDVLLLFNESSVRAPGEKDDEISAMSYLESKGMDMEEAAHMAVNELNLVLRNSGLGHIKVRLAGCAAIEYKALAGVNGTNGKDVRNMRDDEGIGADLDNLIASEAVKRLRNECGADLVTLFVSFPIRGGYIGGISYGLLHESQYRPNDPPSERCAHTVVHIGNLAPGNYTYSHEIGHNFGCGHSREQSSDPGPQYPYGRRAPQSFSAGYYSWEDSKRIGLIAVDRRGKRTPACFASVMCYGTGSVPNKPHVIFKVPCYSTPDRPYTDPDGDSVRIGSSEHNNARVVSITAPLIAHYRSRPNSTPAPQPQAPRPTTPEPPAPETPAPQPPAAQPPATPAPTAPPAAPQPSTPEPPAAPQPSTPEAPAAPAPQPAPAAAAPAFTGKDFLLFILVLLSGSMSAVTLLQLRKIAKQGLPAPVTDPWATPAPAPQPSPAASAAPAPQTRLVSQAAATPPPGQAASQASLELVGTLSTGEAVSYRIPLSLVTQRGRYSLGRGSQCDLRIPDNTISSIHAELRVEGTALYLVDMGSTNGSKVNGLKIGRKESMRLRRGDQISLGQANLRLLQNT